MEIETENFWLSLLLTPKISHSDTLLHTTKSLGFKAFHYPFRSKVSRLLRAEQPPRCDAYAEKDPPAGLS